VFTALVDDHFLDGNPGQMFRGKPFLLIFSGLLVLEKQYTNEEVHQEETAYQDKDHKEEAHND
jgi:hypothetical protein